MPEFDDPRLTLPPGGDGAAYCVSVSAVPLRRAPDPGAEMLTQALWGEKLLLHHETDGFGLVQATSDRYCGWVEMGHLSIAGPAPTHRISALRTHLYSAPKVQAPPLRHLSLGAVAVPTDEREGAFVRSIWGGWLVADHLRPLDDCSDDPAAVAALYLNTPYLWGGRDSLGLDCSGLTQQAFGACGIPLPRDSDMQAAWAGTPIDAWQEPGTLKRNDLVFWKGHVGIMLDPETLLHANGHHMAVVAEPLASAISRIANIYGEPTGARRIDLNGQRKPDWLSALV